jgi:hypothetical protein
MQMDHWDHIAEIIASADALEREKDGQPLTPADVTLLKAGTFFRRMLAPPDRCGMHAECPCEACQLRRLRV